MFFCEGLKHALAAPGTAKRDDVISIESYSVHVRLPNVEARVDAVHVASDHMQFISEHPRTAADARPQVASHSEYVCCLITAFCDTGAIKLSGVGDCYVVRVSERISHVEEMLFISQIPCPSGPTDRLVQGLAGAVRANGTHSQINFRPAVDVEASTLVYPGSQDRAGCCAELSIGSSPCSEGRYENPAVVPEVVCCVVDAVGCSDKVIPADGGCRAIAGSTCGGFE